MIARNFITVADSRHPGYKGIVIIGWSGMRGVVSLAAALSIPVYAQGGAEFPQRNLILFITFVVILTTLLLQGLTLPWLIKKLNMSDPDLIMPDDEMYNKLRRMLSQQALDHLKTNYSQHLETEKVLQQLATKWEDASVSNNEDILMTEEAKKVYREILNLQRQWLTNKNKDHRIDEEIVRKHILHLDLEEEKLHFL